MANEKMNSKITIFVNNQAFEIDRRDLTGGEVKRLAAIPGDYELFQVRGDQTVPVGDEQQVELNEKLHFRAIPAATFGINGIAS